MAHRSAASHLDAEVNDNARHQHPLVGRTADDLVLAHWMLLFFVYFANVRWLPRASGWCHSWCSPRPGRTWVGLDGRFAGRSRPF